MIPENHRPTWSQTSGEKTAEAALKRAGDRNHAQHGVPERLVAEPDAAVRTRIRQVVA